MNTKVSELSKENWKELKERLVTAKRMSEELGVSLRTVRTYLSKYGLTGGKTGPVLGVSPPRSKIAKFLKEHLNELDDRSFAGIARAGGFSTAQVKRYARYLRTEARRVTRQKPWMESKGNVIWRTDDGERIPDGAFDRVRIAISRWGRIRAQVRLKDWSTRTFNLSALELKIMYKEILNDTGKS